MKRTAYRLEFGFKASPHIVHKFLTAPDCLIRWFCDQCDLVDEQYIFVWDDNQETAIVMDDFEEELLRLRWDSYEANEVQEFKIYTSEVTLDTVVEITGFCDADDLTSEKAFWASKMNEMKRAMGA